MAKLPFAEAEVREGDEFDPLPSGNYHALVYETELRQVRELEDGEEPGGPSADGRGKAPKYPGEDMDAWTFQIAEEGLTHRRLWSNTVRAGGGVGMLKQLIIATGKYTEEQIDDEDFDFDPDEICGEFLKLKVRKQGKDRNRIVAFLPADEDFEPPDDLEY